MKEIALPNTLLYEKSNQKESALCKSRKRWTSALCVSAILGISAGLVGLIISALSLSGFLEHSKKISVLGTWLTVAAFPLFIFAAHCLDKIDDTEKAVRLEYSKKHGLNDRDFK